MYSRATTSAMAERPPVLPAGLEPVLVLGAIRTRQQSVREYGIPLPRATHTLLRGVGVSVENVMCKSELNS